MDPLTPEALKNIGEAILSGINVSYWILQSLAMAVTCALIPRLKLTSVFGPLLMVVSLAFVNANVWDAALFFKVPDSFTTQALTLALTNGLIFWILVKLLPGIEVEGIFPALIAPLVFTFCSLFIGQVDKKVGWNKIAVESFTLLQELRERFNGSKDFLDASP